MVVVVVQAEELVVVVLLALRAMTDALVALHLTRFLTFDLILSLLAEKQSASMGNQVVEKLPVQTGSFAYNRELLAKTSISK